MRKFLSDNGFEIFYEVAVKDADKIYSVIKAQFVGKTEKPNEAFYYIGKLNPQNEMDLEYIQKQFKIARDCRDSLKSVTEKQEKYEYYKKLTNEFTKILGEV